MRKTLLAAVPVTVSLALAMACGSNSLVGQGGACFVATDCADGLVCVPVDPAQPSGSRICTNDVSSVATLPPEAGSDAAVADATKPDGPVPDTGPMPDTGTQPDTSAPPDTSVPDTSTPPDSSTD